MKNIQTYVYSKRPYGDENRLNLDWNEADRCVAITPTDILEVVKATNINLYGEYVSKRLSELTSEFYGVSKENYIPVPGSDYGIESLLRVLMQSGDEVFIESLGYKHFEVFARGFGGNVSKLKTDELLDLKDQSSLIYLVNPNNPTGKSVSFKNIELLLENNQNSILVVDEAYIEFSTSTSSVVSLVEKYQNLIVLRTFSKAFGMAGIKFGYLFSSENIINQLKLAVNQKSIPAFVTSLACRALENADRVKSYVSEVNETKAIIAERYSWNILSDSNFFTLKLLDREKLASIEDKFNIGTRTLAETYGVHYATRVTLVGRDNRKRLLAFLDHLVEEKVVDGVYVYE